MKIRSMGVELFHVDSQTGGQKVMTKITVTFHNFAVTPKVGLKVTDYITLYYTTLHYSEMVN